MPGSGWPKAMRPLARVWTLLLAYILAAVYSHGYQWNSGLNTVYSSAGRPSNYTKYVFSSTNSNRRLDTIIVAPPASPSVAAAAIASSSPASLLLSSAVAAFELQPYHSNATRILHPVMVGSKASGVGGVAMADASSVLRNKRGTSLDPAEIARQNKITQQILTQYLERRLYPHRVLGQKAPTIADILPKPTLASTTTTKKPRHRSRQRGFSFSSGYAKKGASSRKTYGSQHGKITNALPAYKRRNRYQDEVEEEDDYADEDAVDEQINEDDAEAEVEANTENAKPEEEMEPIQQQQQLARRLPYHRHHALYRNKYYDDNLEQESLQSFESEQLDSLYGDREDKYGRNEISLLAIDGDCTQCGVGVGVGDEMLFANRWTMPLVKLGEKRYYLSIFFKANWFKATQYCRYHGMHLASVSSQEENDNLEKYIKDYGLGQEHFWTSGTDLAEEGSFFWMSTGRPITFTNWNAGEPNNFRYENGEEENCMELWNRDGKGLKWNDSPCSFETYFVCELQP